MRPLMQLPFAKLEEMFNTNLSDLQVLISLQQELSHRKKPYAIQLLTKVNARLETVQLKPAAQSQRAAGGKASSAASTTASNQVPKVPVRSRSPETTQPPPSFPSTETSYAHLRATFSEKGELMARWGMTPSLPRLLQETVMGGWRDLLRESPTADGRTLVNFERDITRISEISAKEK